MLSAAEISRLAGFEKPWMLNHLEREQIFVPEVERSRHHGRRRNYTFRDLVVLRAINRMLELGVRPKRLKDAIHAFIAACPDVMGDTTMSAAQVKFAASAGRFIITKNSVLFVHSEEEIVDLLKRGQLAFSFMLDNNECTMPSLHAAFELTQLSATQRRDVRTMETIARKHSL